MSNDSVYSDLGFELRPDERRLFLHEMAEVARSYKGSLGPEDEAMQSTDEAGRRIQQLMSELGEETAKFSPRLDVVPLRHKQFASRGLQVPPSLTDRMQRYNFYLLNIPITLMPKAAWGFTHLECKIKFNPEQQPAADRPIAYQIFPHEEWEDLIRAQVGMVVGLDENLEFKADLDQLSLVLPHLHPTVQAQVGFKARSGAQLIVGPFNYHIQRPKIISRGRGNVEVQWRLDSEKYFKGEEPRLGVVLQVPKGVTRVDVVGALQAFRNPALFGTSLFTLLRYVRERTKLFFERGAPLLDGNEWTDVIAGM